MQTRKRMILWTLIVLVAVAAAGVVAFINQPSFGRLPRGERLERIHRSPNYRNGAFHNQSPTPTLTSDRSRLRSMLSFLLRDKTGLRPDLPIEAVKTDLHSLPADAELLVWFGHSAYLLQSGGRRFLVDPTLCTAAPIGALNKPFEGTDIYSPDDMPSIDYLIITHDHWDHLDYHTVRRLRNRIGHVVCPLGVGEHFERWGFAPEAIIEMDWNENSSPEPGVTIHCLPARHFSGRSLKSNQTLWASFLVETPRHKVYFGGDGGYDKHFARIGQQFPQIDLALLENGQYNQDWRYIHTMPDQLALAARDLGARRIITGHHAKYALARHPWNEPLATERAMQANSLPVITARIGAPVTLD